MSVLGACLQTERQKLTHSLRSSDGKQLRCSHSLRSSDGKQLRCTCSLRSSELHRGLANSNLGSLRAPGSPEVFCGLGAKNAIFMELFRSPEPKKKPFSSRVWVSITACLAPQNQKKMFIESFAAEREEQIVWNDFGPGPKKGHFFTRAEGGGFKLRDWSFSSWGVSGWGFSRAGFFETMFFDHSPTQRASYHSWVTGRAETPVQDSVVDCSKLAVAGFTTLHKETHTKVRRYTDIPAQH